MSRHVLRLSYSGPPLGSGYGVGGPSGPLQPTADYKAADRSNRLRPAVKGLPAMGASGDWHLRRGRSQLYIGELGQEFDRNNPVGRRMLNCMEENILQDTGFLLNPDTGDAKADKDIRARWQEESSDKNKIDAAGEYSFDKMARFVLRQQDAAGDIFALITRDGPIELLEHHRCQSPSGAEATNKNLVDGVEMDDDRRRLAYWFTKEPISPLSGHTPKLNEVTRRAAYYEHDGYRLPNVLHIRDPQRYTQTRGLSLFAAVFDFLAMHDELQFQQLLKSQLANLFLVKRTRGASFDVNNYSKREKSGVEEEIDRYVDRFMETLAPGAELKGMKGEELDLLSPKIPNETWFLHMKLVLRIIGIVWGLPYVLMLLDTADTTFHGYRGVLNNAKDTFRKRGKDLAEQFHTPVYVDRLHRWADDDQALKNLRNQSRRPGSKLNLFRHGWTRPGWDSVDPVSDATANLIEQSNSLNSPRRAAAAVDAEWDTLSREIVQDRFKHADRGLKAARKLLTRNGMEVTDEAVERWGRTLAPLPTSERTQVSLALSSQSGAGQTQTTNDNKAGGSRE